MAKNIKLPNGDSALVVASVDKDGNLRLDNDGNPLLGSVFAESYDSVTGIPRYQITPTVNGVATPEVICDASAGNVLVSAIAVFNALDNVTASDAVRDRYPDVKKIDPGWVTPLGCTENITKVWVLAFGTADNTVGNVIAESTTDGATIRAALIEFTFDAIDEVRTVNISYGSRKTSATATTDVLNQFGVIRVEGYSHA